MFLSNKAMSLTLLLFKLNFPFVEISLISFALLLFLEQNILLRRSFDMAKRGFDFNLVK